MNFWKSLSCFFIAVCYLPLTFAAGSPAGNWTTIDDKTGAKRALVNLSISDGVLSGHIVKVYSRAGDTGICSKCPGAFKDKKIQGLGFIWGLKDEGNGVWSGGSILDPQTGKIYKVKATLQGNKMYVRGYVGVSMLGRTQTWVR
ncbi:DUF2147 domain-containing protein [Legionella worsleiensis]|uniref:Putative signal peptide protein n=1 Tax=Legionella worsleiensis TaxID=45076 RepID=A0A0W1A399_9GAMM|nr:DUF2147 domain-containing protein [Legionella worsleiensis]KTD75837.1 putative signal peptide protein [Legionella worsleiensis]STY32849.1 putative signal peptide protein [Legionella worsleiensis]